MGAPPVAMYSRECRLRLFSVLPCCHVSQRALVALPTRPLSNSSIALDGLHSYLAESALSFVEESEARAIYNKLKARGAIREHF